MKPEILLTQATNPSSGPLHFSGKIGWARGPHVVCSGQVHTVMEYYDLARGCWDE